MGFTGDGESGREPLGDGGVLVGDFLIVECIVHEVLRCFTHR